MDFFDVVATRGSYRGPFLDTPVPRDDLERILAAGLQAPSGYNFQTTSFWVVTDAACRAKIAGVFPTPAVETAPAIIVVLSEHRANGENGLSFEIEDYAAATENVMLALTALGYAGVWMDGAIKLGKSGEKLADLLSVPKHLHVRTIVPIGRPRDAVSQKEKKPLPERVKFI